MNDQKAKRDPPRPDSPPRQRHHLVSKGYQKNFADDQLRLTILNSQSGKVVELLRPAKRNWVEDEWNTYWHESGDPNRHLEREFAKIEAGTLRRIRDVTAEARSTAEDGAIISLAAMHLVRSKSFVEFRSHIHRVSEPGLISELSADPELPARYMAEKGRLPAKDELMEMLEKASADLMADRRWLTESLGEQYNKIAGVLAENTIQILTLADHLPNLPLGDQPVVHADLASGRFGFRDHLAVGDANLVLIPLTRIFRRAPGWSYENALRPGMIGVADINHLPRVRRAFPWFKLAV